MSVEGDRRTPFVLGKPIKNPLDFYDREEVLGPLYQAALQQELVAVVGEHRCGNTSVLYQLLHEDQRARYLRPQEDARLLFAFVSCQLAADGPESFYRRVAVVLRRADPGLESEPPGQADRVWIEAFLEDLAAQGRHLVLLLDELEVMAGFDPAFWEWFQTLVTEYDVGLIASTRMDPGQHRAEQGGPPFFNMFRSVYIGSFSQEAVDHFLREKSEITDFGFQAVRPVIDNLAGRFPYYIQVAAALFYLYAGGESQVSPEQTALVIRDFKERTAMLFGDAWHKLPEIEREALVWLAAGGRPGGDSEQRLGDALRSLERRGYVIDGHIFSSAFADFVREHATVV